LKTETKKGSVSEGKTKFRYHTKPYEEESTGNTKRFFFEPSSEFKETTPASVKNGSVGGRSCKQSPNTDFLKKLKERYGNKHIRQTTEKSELQISSEKVTLMQHSNAVRQ